MDEVAAAESRRALAAFAVYRSTNAGAWIEVKGWSMSPLISPGDELYVEFGARRPQRGEIAVFPRRRADDRPPCRRRKTLRIREL